MVSSPTWGLLDDAVAQRDEAVMAAALRAVAIQEPLGPILDQSCGTWVLGCLSCGTLARALLGRDEKGHRTSTEHVEPFVPHPLTCSYLIAVGKALVGTILQREETRDGTP